MPTSLVPLSIGDVFDEAFDLYKANFTLFAGIVAVVHVPTQIASAIVLEVSGVRELLSRMGTVTTESSGSAVAAQMLGMFAIYLVLWAAETFAFAVQSGALTVAVSERYLGQDATIRSAYRVAFRRLLPLLGTWLLVVLILMGTVFAAIWAGLLLLVASAGPMLEAPGIEQAALIGGLLVLAAATLAGLLSLVSLGAFVTQEVVLEKVAYGEAVARNWRLTRRRLLPISAALLLCAVLMIGFFVSAYGALSFVVGFAGAHLFQLSSDATQWVQSALMALIWLFLQPFWMVSLTLLYYDQRVRREGLDLSLLERQLASAQGARP